VADARPVTGAGGNGAPSGDRHREREQYGRSRRSGNAIDAAPGRDNLPAARLEAVAFLASAGATYLVVTVVAAQPPGYLDRGTPSPTMVN